MLSQLDWLSKRISRDRIHKSVRIHRGENGYGILFDDGCVIRVIEEKSTASNSGLCVGDKVLCINGCACRGSEDLERAGSACRSLVLSVASSLSEPLLSDSV